MGEPGGDGTPGRRGVGSSMSTATLDRPGALDLPTPYTATELSGVLPVPEHLRGVSLADLTHLVQHACEGLKERRFLCGDASLAYIAESGAETPAERAQALQTLINDTGIGREELYQALRVCWMFPYGEARDRYQDKPWSWYATITDRSAFLGPPGERQPEVQALAETLAEETAREARRQLDTLREERTTGAALLDGQTGREVLEAFVERGQPALPADERTELETLRRQVRDVESRLAEMERRYTVSGLTAGLKRRFQDAEPGTYPEMVACVEQHLAAQGVPL